jgi:hypothetical protein
MEFHEQLNKIEFNRDDVDILYHDLKNAIMSTLDNTDFQICPDEQLDYFKDNITKMFIESKRLYFDYKNYDMGDLNNIIENVYLTLHCELEKVVYVKDGSYNSYRYIISQVIELNNGDIIEKQLFFMNSNVNIILTDEKIYITENDMSGWTTYDFSIDDNKQKQVSFNFT